MSILKEAIERFRKIVESNNLLNNPINIKTEYPKPEETVEKPINNNHLLLEGREVLIEANFFNAKSHVFTDEPSNFEGTIKDALALPLTSNKNRAVVVATINAVLRHLDKITGTIHCKDEESKECAYEMAERLYNRWGEHLTIGIIGLQPDIARTMIKRFSKGNVQITDLDSDNIGKEFDGVTILDGKKYTNRVVANNFLALVTGSVVVNETIDDILEISRQNNKNRIVIFFGTTIAGVDKLMNLRRMCFKSH